MVTVKRISPLTLNPSSLSSRSMGCTTLTSPLLGSTSNLSVPAKITIKCFRLSFKTFLVRMTRKNKHFIRFLKSYFLYGWLNIRIANEIYLLFASFWNSHSNVRANLYGISMLEISFQTCLELEYCVGVSEAALAVLNFFVWKKNTRKSCTLDMSVHNSFPS